MSGTDDSGLPATRRRQRGIFERPKGSGIWWARYHDQHGREHREKVGPKGLALKVYQKRKTEVQEGRYFPERLRRRDPLLRDVIDDYLPRVKGRLRSFPDHARCGRLWKDALGNYPLRQVVAGDVQRYVARRLTEVRPATVNREVAFLKRVFNVAIEDGLADTNPVRKVRLLREDNTRVRYLADDEEARLRQEIGDPHWPVVALALNTGLRRAEQFNLSWEHVDFNANVLTIPRTKAGRTRRVPMNSLVRDHLRALPSRLKGPWVFPSASGETPLDSQNFMNRVFVPAVKRAGIQDFRWHDLRHTFASRLVMQGVDIRTTQELLGHADIRMTLRYSHLSPSHLLDAVEKLLDGTGTTTGTSESAPEERQVAESGTARTHRGTQRATRRSRTGDLLITNGRRRLLGGSGGCSSVGESRACA
jgi:integrase